LAILALKLFLNRLHEIDYTMCGEFCIDLTHKMGINLISYRHHYDCQLAT
jgi:hypothetical protein